MRDKSDENWRVGERCLEDGDLNAATSRVYYSVFQAVLGWARAKKGYCGEVGPHSAMRRMMNDEGKGSSFYSRKFSELLGLRETADYSSETPAAEDLRELIPIGEKIREYYISKAQEP